MDKELISSICSGDLTKQEPLLQKLIEKNSPNYAFPDLDSKEKRLQLWSALFGYLENSAAILIHPLCLTNIKILSRDKEYLDDIVCDKWINTLLELSGLQQLTINEDKDNNASQKQPDDGTIEALKCLCNLIYNSTAVQNICVGNCLVDGLVARLRVWKAYNLPYDIKYFDMRLLFIITAVKEEKRKYVKDDLHALAYLTENLDEVLRDLPPLKTSPVPPKMIEGDLQFFVDEKKVILICEMLRTLFNIVLVCGTDVECTDEDESSIVRLMSLCNTLLLCASVSLDKTNYLHSNVVNFLTGVPASCYAYLAPLITNEEASPIKHKFDSRDITTVYLLLKYLDSRTSQLQNTSGQYDNLSPILSVLHRAASTHPYMRKYLRASILPPLKDIHTRPEEGNTLRNKLCRLLTTPVTQIRDLVAQFLFILCKENVSRMVKYTGYGNAAGLFATKGLLDMKNVCKSAKYSSDSEDSDTEEYKSMKHTINPVTGCYEAPHQDPMAGCTEEQKEYEAMKLVNLMAQLSKSGVIQPCTLGPDGKPQPVEHILQLQEGLPNQQVHKKE